MTLYLLCFVALIGLVAFDVGWELGREARRQAERDAQRRQAALRAVPRNVVVHPLDEKPPWR